VYEKVRLAFFLGLWAVIAITMPAPASADEPAASDLRTEIQQLRRQQQALAKQMAVIQKRIDDLSKRAGVAVPASQELDLEALRRAAEQAAGPGAAKPQKAPEEVAFTSMNRLQSAANPEISFIGDMVASINDNDAEANLAGEGPPYLKGRDKFTLPVAELNLQLPVDPFSSAKTVIHFHDGLAEVEEAYLEYANLGGWKVRFGQMRPTISLFNRWHAHALPQVDSPRLYNWHLRMAASKTSVWSSVACFPLPSEPTPTNCSSRSSTAEMTISSPAKNRTGRRWVSI